MAASTGSSALPHRAVANIKSPGGGLSGPSTPMRGIASNFGSPSSLRAEEDLLLIEFGTRKLHIGFAGDAVHRGSVWFGPDQQRRVGDFRVWQMDYRDEWAKREPDSEWGKSHELWQPDVRGLDLGLVEDRVERAMREAITKYMLIDSRPRRMVCALPTGLPLPILSATLDTLFNRFMSPTISLLSIPVAVAVGAGVRSALVVDLGWSETVITSVYEYREVRTDRSIRAGRMLTEQTHKLLASHLSQPQQRPNPESEGTKHVLSFEECNEVASRVVWCKPSPHSAATNPEDGLATVEEQDESDVRSHPPGSGSGHAKVTIPLRSGATPVSLELSFDQLAEPCENTFFDSQCSPRSFDDHELPLHLLVYRSLLELPLDVRAVCMSRIIFTGGCANVLGLRKRVFDDVAHLIREKGWDPVQIKSSDKPGTASRLKKQGSRQGNSGPTSVQPGGADGEDQDGVWHDAANTVPEVDPVEEQLKRSRDRKEHLQVRGKMRVIESLGAWSGASLITQLKAPAIATIDRDIWQQQGAAGASRAGDVDPKSQRQSVGPAIRGATSGSSWTLGVWGVV